MTAKNGEPCFLSGNKKHCGIPKITVKAIQVKEYLAVCFNYAV